MKTEYITELGFAADIGMAMLIWLVQVVIYPSFRFIAPEGFHRWHHRYMRTMSLIVVPLILFQAVCHGLLTLRDPSAVQWITNAMLAGAWMVTFFLSVPCHKDLQASGYRIEIINRLVRTNWLRTLCWSLVMLLHAVSR